jgi:hypothetical protein
VYPLGCYKNHNKIKTNRNACSSSSLSKPSRRPFCSRQPFCSRAQSFISVVATAPPPYNTDTQNTKLLSFLGRVRYLLRLRRRFFLSDRVSFVFRSRSIRVPIPLFTHSSCFRVPIPLFITTD